jgi:hypothetical protein
MPFRSGAYLFKTDSQRPENLPVFESDTRREVVIVSGTVFSELSLVHEGPRCQFYFILNETQFRPEKIGTNFTKNFVQIIGYNDIKNLGKYKTNLCSTRIKLTSGPPPSSTPSGSTMDPKVSFLA